jgi:hypothetical protein
LSEKPTMRRSQRLIAAAVLISLSGALAGCSGSLSSFDPSDLLDFLDTKKKLPGDRKPVFPEGVPGLEQGVPKDLYKGSAQQRLDQQNAQATAAASAPPPEPQRSKQSKGKTKQPATASTSLAPPPGTEPGAEPVPDEEGSPAAVPSDPKPKKIVRKRTTAPPADQAQQPAPSGQPAQQSSAPFPAPMPSGTFTR